MRNSSYRNSQMKWFVSFYLSARCDMRHNHNRESVVTRLGRSLRRCLCLERQIPTCWLAVVNFLYVAEPGITILTIRNFETELIRAQTQSPNTWIWKTLKKIWVRVEVAREEFLFGLAWTPDRWASVRYVAVSRLRSASKRSASIRGIKKNLQLSLWTYSGCSSPVQTPFPPALSSGNRCSRTGWRMSQSVCSRWPLVSGYTISGVYSTRNSLV